MITVTMAEVEEAKRSIIRHHPVEINYPGTLYRAAEEIVILRKNLAMCKDLNRDIIEENNVSEEHFNRWRDTDNLAPY